MTPESNNYKLKHIKHYIITSKQSECPITPSTPPHAQKRGRTATTKKVNNLTNN